MRSYFGSILSFCSLCSLAVIPTYGSSSDLVSANADKSCQPNETECALGCCPFAEGVCCADGFECCQHGQICLPFGMCIRLENKNGEPTLASSKSTPVKSSTPCPSGTTSCGDGKCCPFEDATCCADDEHCCPQGYWCDLVHLKCIKMNTELDNEIDNEIDIGVRAVPPQKTVMMSPYKTCPGRGKMCPSATSCCINDNNAWDCCPKPPSQQKIRSGDHYNCGCMDYLECIGRGGNAIGLCSDYSTLCCLPQKRKTDFVGARGIQVSEAGELTKNGGGPFHHCCDTYWGHTCCEVFLWQICTYFGCI